MAEERKLDPHFVELSKAFLPGEYTDAAGNRIWYRLFAPALEEKKEYPLVVFLHGAGERGEDNEIQVAGNRGAVVWTEASEQADRPCYVLAPQAPTGKDFTAPEFEAPFMAFLEQFVRENPVDRQRIYLTGLSMGGMGTWHYCARYPNVWAAAAPICGAGDPMAIRAAKDIPFWTFHAVDDPFVPIAGIMAREGAKPRAGTRIMASALLACGASVRSTEYPAGYIHEHYDYPKAVAGHAAWEPAYSDGEFRAWLFRQDRRDRDRITFLRPGLWQLDDWCGATYYLTEGKDKALVIDTGMGGRPIPPLLMSLTDKPLELAITHAHPDHALHAGEFTRIYVPAAERALLDPKGSLPPEDPRIVEVQDGDVIPLGGSGVEAVLCAGHTPGSTVYIDHGRRCIFCGDAIGSGTFVLMSLPGSLSLSAYREQLLKLADRLVRCTDYAWFGGHSAQAAGTFDYSDFRPAEDQLGTYNPLRFQVVRDMAELCRLILAGEAERKPMALGPFHDPDDPSFVSSFGSATILVRESQAN